jgi:hypothetical protein
MSQQASSLKGQDPGSKNPPLVLPSHAHHACSIGCESPTIPWTCDQHHDLSMTFLFYLMRLYNRDNRCHWPLQAWLSVRERRPGPELEANIMQRRQFRCSAGLGCNIRTSSKLNYERRRKVHEGGLSFHGRTPSSGRSISGNMQA